MNNKYAFVIPCYQHSFTLEKIIEVIKNYDFPIFIVDDGSGIEHKSILKSLELKYPLVQILRHNGNKGKGVAVQTGLKAAYNAGCTHAIQVDADGQHDLTSLPHLLEQASNFPNGLVSGKPIYGSDVPRSRLYGRYITHFWVWVETLGFHIKDSMCGFRVYPIKWTLDVCEKITIGKRMDFDTDIMVRLYWYGVDSHFVPVKVHYPENGLSHFKVLEDNIRISKMHTRLFFGMLVRIPKIIFLKFGFLKKRSDKNIFWYEIQERGAILGVKVLFFIYKILGRRIVSLMLWPISFYYFLFFSKARKASQLYLGRYKIYFKKPQSFSALKHIYAFADMILDRMSVWCGHINKSNIYSGDHQKFMSIYQKDQGAFLLSSHYGNIEVCRCLGMDSYVKFNALVDYNNSQMINGFISKINTNANLNIISTHDFGLSQAMKLQDKVIAGEWVIAMGDRQTKSGGGRFLNVKFLGKSCVLPEGPFLMAYIFDVPIYVLHCFKKAGLFRIKVVPLSKDIRLSRQTGLQDLAQQYANCLEDMVKEDPYQWFNFFDFWKE